MSDKFEVIDLETGDSHGEYDTLEEARGCVAFDGLTAYQIWRIAGAALVAATEGLLREVIRERDDFYDRVCRPDGFVADPRDREELDRIYRLIDAARDAIAVFIGGDAR